MLLLLMLVFVCTAVAVAQRSELPRLNRGVVIDTLQVTLRFDAALPDSLQQLFRQSFEKATERFYRRSPSFIITTNPQAPHPSLVMELGPLRYPRPSGSYLALALNMVQLAAHIYWLQSADTWFPLFLYLHPNTSAWIWFSSESGLLRSPRRNHKTGDLILSNAFFSGKERQHKRFARELEWEFVHYLRAFHRQNKRNMSRLNN